MLQNRWRNWGLVFITIITSLVLVITASAFRSNASQARASISLEQVPNSSLVAQAANQQEFDAVNSIAKATTVFIGREIENRKSLEAKGVTFDDAGSGVIIARRNSTYYVLTNEHVVRPRVKFGIRTHDGELHQVQNSLPPHKDKGQPDLNKDLVERFGVYDSKKNFVNGYDLALLQFDSSEEYPVAPIGDSSTMTAGEPVFVSGWPLPKTTSEANSEDRRRVFKDGKLERILNPADPNGNYNLCYTADTARGMSGGPVFNAKGEVIGIHGAGKNKRQSCFENSLGIKINDLINQQEKIERYRLTNAFKRPPADPSEFARMVKNPRADILTVEEYKKFFDVSPEDPSFSAILSMVDKYNCMKVFDDGSFRPLDPQTRGDFALDINTCLNQMAQKLAAGGSAISREDFKSIQKTVLALTEEIPSLKNKE